MGRTLRRGRLEEHFTSRLNLDTLIWWRLALSTIRGKGALTWDNSGCEATIWPKVGGIFSMQRSLQVLDRVSVGF